MWNGVLSDMGSTPSVQFEYAYGQRGPSLSAVKPSGWLIIMLPALYACLFVKNVERKRKEEREEEGERLREGEWGRRKGEAERKR